MSLRFFAHLLLSPSISSSYEFLEPPISHRFHISCSAISYSHFSWICASPIRKCSSSSRIRALHRHSQHRLGWQSVISASLYSSTIRWSFSTFARSSSLFFFSSFHFSLRALLRFLASWVWSSFFSQYLGYSHSYFFSWSSIWILLSKYLSKRHGMRRICGVKKRTPKMVTMILMDTKVTGMIHILLTMIMPLL